jgi:hypothetical protein
MPRRSDSPRFTPTKKHIDCEKAAIQAGWEDENAHRVGAYRRVDVQPMVVRRGRPEPSALNDDYGE